jgi:hypothetical protein
VAQVLLDFFCEPLGQDFVCNREVLERRLPRIQVTIRLSFSANNGDNTNTHTHARRLAIFTDHCQNSFQREWEEALPSLLIMSSFGPLVFVLCEKLVLLPCMLIVFALYRLCLKPKPRLHAHLFHPLRAQNQANMSQRERNQLVICTKHRTSFATSFDPLAHTQAVFMMMPKPVGLVLVLKILIHTTPLAMLLSHLLITTLGVETVFTYGWMDYLIGPSVHIVVATLAVRRSMGVITRKNAPCVHSAPTLPPTAEQYTSAHRGI